MKYYNIRLPYGPAGYIYPPNYESTIGSYNQAHMYYDNKETGDFTLLIAIPDANALSVLPANVTELSEREAFALSRQYESRKTIITNEAVVRNLEIKAKAGITLTQRDLDALNPSKPEPGFGMNKTFEDNVNEKKKLEARK